MTAAELRAAIDALDLTQKDFAARFDIPLRTLVRYLAGDPIPKHTATVINIHLIMEGKR